VRAGKGGLGGKNRKGLSIRTCLKNQALHWENGGPERSRDTEKMTGRIKIVSVDTQGGQTSKKERKMKGEKKKKEEHFSCEKDETLSQSPFLPETLARKGFCISERVSEERRDKGRQQNIAEGKRGGQLEEGISH